jgi:hypothetical protein
MQANGRVINGALEFQKKVKVLAACIMHRNPFLIHPRNAIEQAANAYYTRKAYIQSRGTFRVKEDEAKHEPLDKKAARTLSETPFEFIDESYQNPTLDKNRSSIHRLLARKIYLVVKDGGQWKFPSIEHAGDDALHIVR